MRDWGRQRIANETEEQRALRRERARKSVAKRRAMKRAEARGEQWNPSGHQESQRADHEYSQDCSNDFENYEEVYVEEEEEEKQLTMKQIQANLARESRGICYFCLAPLKAEPSPVSDVASQLTYTHNPVIAADGVPPNMCFTCCGQVKSFLETYEMIQNSNKYWNSVAQKVYPNSYKSTILQVFPSFSSTLQPNTSGAMISVFEPADDDMNNENVSVEYILEDDSTIPDGIFEPIEEPPPVRVASPIEEKPVILPADDKPLPQAVSQAESGENDFNEFNFLCRLCMIGFMDRTEVILHGMTAHKMMTARMVGNSLVSHRVIKDTTNFYCVKCWQEFDGKWRERVN